MLRVLSCLTVLAIGQSMFSCKEENLLPPHALEELNNVEQAMFAATAAGDSAAFRKVCGADYFTINANGEAHNLEESVPAVPRFKGFTNVLSEQDQRVFGTFVIRTGRLKVFQAGKPVAEVLYSTGWMYRDGRWQFVHWQGTLAGMMLEPLANQSTLEPPAVTNSYEQN